MTRKNIKTLVQFMISWRKTSFSRLSIPALTGYNTAPCSYPINKLRMFKKVLADKAKLGLPGSLRQIQKLTNEVLETELTRFVIYSGKDDEDCADT